MFQGYTDETFEFFMAIRFNNNTDFFHSNHDWYQRAVRTPSIELAAALSSVIEEIDNDLERRPNRVVSRINRDIRFSKDKSPYRDYIWLAFRKPKEEHATSISLYFDISADHASCGMGYYAENRELMNALRRAILADPEPLLEAMQPIEQDFSLFTSAYRRITVPETVPTQLIPLYKAKGFYFEKDLTNFDLIKSPDLANVIIDGYHRLTPLYRYLEAITPEQESVPESET